MSDFRAERFNENTCVVTIEGCFPPCCGSTSIVTRVEFGEDLSFIPDQDTVNSCNQISFSLSNGDSTAIHDQHISPSLLLMEGQSIDLVLKDKDIEKLQICFKLCSNTIDIGHNLTKLNFTKGCYSVNVTISPPQEFLNSNVQIQLQETNFTYCELIEEPSSLMIRVGCIGFNPEDTILQEKIVFVISNNGVCMATYETKFEDQETGV